MSKLSFIIVILLIVSLTIQLSAQNFSGKVVDATNLPIVGSTLFIKELNQGLVCNENGEFQTTLKKGTYTLTTRCLGYKPLNQSITIDDTKSSSITITLQNEPLHLQEVVVSNKEDPAYEIMRKAIAKAPYHLAYIKEYTAECYMKGNMILDKVAKLIDKASSSEGVKLSDYKGQTFVMESFSEIQFTGPDKYKQTVKAFSNSIPDNVSPSNSMRMTQASLYAPLYNGIISPLNKEAFSYYKYRYEGFIEENGKIINKIKFSAKLKDARLTNGYIYIVDNSYHISYAEIEQNIFGVKQNLLITYNEIKENAFLPVSYTKNLKINVFGTKGEVNYYSSIKYNDLKINDKIDKQLGDLKKAKRKLEIKKDTLYTVLSDSLATKRDSIFWTQIRSVPLSQKEETSYIRKDSMKQHIDSLKHKYHKPGFSFSNLILGGRIGSDTARIYLDYDGLLLAVPEYNFVDGAWLGQKVNLTLRLKEHNKLKISPYAYYTYGRNSVIYGGKAELNYAPMSLGKLSLSGGSVSEDFNPLAITRFDNAIASATYRESYNYFYQKDFVAAKNSIDLANGLKLSTSLEIAKRHGLTNNANWGIWGDPQLIKPNIRSDERFDLSSYSVALTYAPYAYYTVTKGKKEYEQLSSPIFWVEYSEGFSGWQTNNSQYRKLQASVSQSIKLGYFSRFMYEINGGSFVGDTNKLHFADYQHFNTSNMFSVSKTPFETHMLLDNYRASTSRYWLRSQVDYQSDYILLKRIPLLQGIPFTENLHLKNLYTPDLRSYSELGYSVDLKGLLNVGMFASFRNASYENFGLRLCYNLRKLITGK